MTSKTKQLILVFTTVVTFSFGQEYVGVHQEHEQKFGNKNHKISISKNSVEEIIPLKKHHSKSLNKAVFGFLPYWEYASGAHSNMQYDLLSHVAVFSFKASSNGALSNPSNWPWTNVINTAHTKNTKVIMVVTNFKKAEIHTLMTNSTSKNNLFNNIKNTIETYQLDGVNIDFEGLDVNDRGDVLNSFMRDLTNYIHSNLPGKEVSFDSPAVNWSGWKLKELAENVDYLFVMAYDYNGGWSTKTGAVAPLTNASGGICVERSLNRDYRDAISSYPNKIILGVPYYGRHWKTQTSSPRSTITSYVGAAFYKNSVEEAVTKGGFLFDNNSNSSWYRWQNSNWNQVWIDNENSLEKKYDLALSKNLKGIGIWALNYDGNKTELWNLIDTKFNTTLATNDALSKNGITLLPNPAQNEITISNPNTIEISSVSIYNIQGQLIKKINPVKNKVNVSNLANALYLFRLTDKNNRQQTFKVLKI